MKYDSYKPSGIEWLGDVPSHWGIEKVKWIFRHVTEMSEKNNDHELLSVYTDIGVKPRKELEARGNKASSTDNYWIVKKGDIVVNKLLAWMGAVGLSNYDGVTSPAYDVLRPIKDIDVRYYNYIFRSSQTLSEFKKRSKGIMEMRLRLYFDELGQILFPIPPKDEQKAIADFLDKKCESIDNYILKQKELLELLKEKKSSLINRAVTKGIDSSVEYKDSGVEWIGKIPRHWDAIKIKRMCSVKRGASPRPIDDPRYFDENGEYSWVRIADVTKSEKYLYETTQKMSKEGSLKSVKMEPNKIFLSIAGSVGKPIISKIKCCIHDGFVWFDRLPKNIDINFLYYIFLTGEAYKGLGKLGTQLNLNTDTVGMISIPMMSLEEQKQIVIYIETETKKIDDVISNIEDELQLLQEYKQSIISSAVTGKIKV